MTLRCARCGEAATSECPEVCYSQQCKGKFSYFYEDSSSAVNDVNAITRKAYLNINYLLKNVKTYLESNIDFLNSIHYLLNALWIIVSWTPEIWDFYCYYCYKGNKKSGKSRATRTTERIAYNPLPTVSSTVAAIFRSLKSEFKTLLIDEFRINVNPTRQNETDVAMLQILNNGYAKGGQVLRVEGKRHQVVAYPTAGFKCLNTRYTLPEDLRSRCIIALMQKTRTRFPIRIKGDVDKLRQMLATWREYALKYKEQFEPNDKIEDKLFQASGQDGRLVELYYALYIVAPKNVKPRIIKYLREIGEQEFEEEMATLEYEVFESIMEVYKQDKENWFSTRKITEEFNAGKPEKEQYKSRMIGRIIGELGFQPHRTAKQKGWHWNIKLIKKLMQRYNCKYALLTPTKTAQTSLKKEVQSGFCEECAVNDGTIEKFNVDGKERILCRTCRDNE